MCKAPRGTKDIYGQELYLYIKIQNKIREIFYNFNFDEIRTPIFENTELFTRSSGENSDIVNKEMYTFFDKSNRSLTLKPEGTAPVVRSAIENNLFLTNPKLFYFTPAFRYERPQAGRYREFYQCDIDIIGDGELSIINDAQMPIIIYNTFKDLGFHNFTISINNRKILNGLFASLNLSENSKVRYLSELSSVNQKLFFTDTNNNRLVRLNSDFAQANSIDAVKPIDICTSKSFNLKL